MSARRLALLAAGEWLGWPALRSGSALLVRAGEVAWRQAVTLAEPADLATLERLLADRQEDRQ